NGLQGLRMSASLRSNLRRLVLRGPVHDRWVARRGRQIDAAYCAQLVNTLSATPAPAAAPSFTSPGALRQILLIADCMWEQNDLVPELARIAEIRTLDLHPMLATHFRRRTPAEIVTQTVRDLAAIDTARSPD